MRGPKSGNGTMMQYFHWYVPADGSLWSQVAKEAAALAKDGMTALWLPPAYKGAAGEYDVGYSPYDLYDLGEFHQKNQTPGATRTKYGTKDEYLAAIRACHDAGMQVYADIVLNHKGGGDETEWVKCAKVAEDNRGFVIQDEVWITAWTRFKFPGRQGKYSDYQWGWDDFDGVDWAENLGEKAIFKFLSRGKDWAKMVSKENGNYDFLMFSDIDMNAPNVRTELSRWAKWYVSFTGVDGFRLDAVKHIQYSFFRDWLGELRKTTGKPLFAVGEYWNPYNVEDLHTYLSATDGCMSLFDAPLHRNFYEASRAGGNYDMRRLLDNTLMQQQPALAVTLVDNDDTQPCQVLESWVDYWFKPIAYAVILLRSEGYPCLFYADWYGASYTDKGHHINLAPVPGLRELVQARQRFAYGLQRDWFDHFNTIGWTREGDDDHPGAGCAVLASDGAAGDKWMEVGRRHAGRTFVDWLGNCAGTVTIDNNGWGHFRCEGGSVSVWVPR